MTVDAPRLEPLHVVYSDDALLAVVKPAWWVVHKTRGAKDAPRLVELLTATLGAPVFPVHRLDRQASGLLVLARSREVARILCDQLRDGHWRKRYLALCRGVISEPIRVDRGVREGDVRRDAVTCFEPLEVFCNRYTLVQAEPLTGRRHQIRYHLKHLSHPIIGDTNYGSGPLNRFFRESFALDRLFLHATRLVFAHPTEPKRLELAAPLPAELEALLTALRSYDGPVV